MMWDERMPLEYRNAIVTGDARVLAERIPDESVDLIFTDPIYSERPLYDWLAQVARRILRPGGAVLCWSNGKWHRTNANWLEAGGLVYRYDFGNVMVGGPQPMNGRIISKTNRIIWLDISGKSKMLDYLADGLITATEANTGWRWGKSPRATKDAMLAFARASAVVFDPFCGEGATPALAKMLDRNFIAFESDLVRADRARARVEATQAMHPVLLGVQEEIAWAS